MGRNGIINNDILYILYKSIKTGLFKRAIPQGFSSTMAISNCLFSPLLKIPTEFSAWCVFAKSSANPRNYS